MSRFDYTQRLEIQGPHPIVIVPLLFHKASVRGLGPDGECALSEDYTLRLGDCAWVVNENGQFWISYEDDYTLYYKGTPVIKITAPRYQDITIL